ncbi:hypothetical protein [Blastopirellula marina]|uniref:Uncharacterized protein n=1 Tax=Blastopirellula marina DSM 3645 TaxID=314230 RepID=A3ZSS6_9BACT|nr:hypothetical protein [Blastopirellula marina]EAQ80350.1 hypothetical protein DSM3645_10912 [Blastopirellula marina DSM 3645]
MPTLMIVLKREIPDVQSYVHGHELSEREEELTLLAQSLGVRPLMDFFGQGADETDFFLEDELDLGGGFELPQETWFAPAEGLLTIAALLAHLEAKPATISAEDSVRRELRQWQSLLQTADKHQVLWHVAVDF